MMQLIHEIDAVNQVCKIREGTVWFSRLKDKKFSKGGYGLYVYENGSETALIEEPVCFFCSINSSVAYHNFEGGNLMIFDGKNKIKSFQGCYYFASSNIRGSNDNYIKLGEGKDPLNTNRLFLDNAFHLHNVREMYNLRINNYFLLYKYTDNTEVSCYDLEENLLWTVDISRYGLRPGFDEKTNSPCKIPNVTDGELMGDEARVYVPLRGGQLIALDRKNGHLLWMLEQEHAGLYALLDNKIYKRNAKELFEINPLDGSVLRQMRYDESERFPQLKEVWASGPFWVHDDYIILGSHSYAKMFLVNRKTFEVEEYITWEGSGYAHSNNVCAWDGLNQRLYVLDKSFTLRIFEVNN